MIKAQNHLNNYLDELNKDDLEIYFQSIRNITSKIDSTKVFGNSIPSIKTFETDENQLQLENLEKLIDSVYNHLPEKIKTKAPTNLKDFNLSSTPPEFEMEEIYFSVTFPRKKFFTKLKVPIIEIDILKTNK